jgi:hypothetical protein
MRPAEEFGDDRSDPEESGELDRDFPLGDGTADSDALVFCPHCGEAVEIALDPGSGPVQSYVEDCEVCCRPWQVTVRYHASGGAEVAVQGLEE